MVKCNFGLPESAIQKIQSIFEHYSSIEKVTLFGSRALGTYKIGSDIDLCIESNNLSLTELLSIENQLDDLMLPWKIDLLLKSELDNLDLVDHINQEGKQFYP